MANKSIGRLIFQSLLLLILLFSLVRLVMIKEGSLVVFELLLLALLLVLTVIGLATYKTLGNKLIFTVFLFYTLNLLLLWVVYKSLYLTLFLISLIGLWVSLPSRKKREAVEAAKPSAPPQKIVDAKAPKAEEPKAEPKAEPKVGSKEKAALVKTKFTPGKYVASKRSNVYHEPRCDWAKKVKKERQVWFASREEALNKGYKKHDCVK